MGCQDEVQLVNCCEDWVGIFVTETVMVFDLQTFDEVMQRLREGGSGVILKAVFPKVPNGVKKQCMQYFCMPKPKINGEIGLLIEDGCQHGCRGWL